MRKILFVLLPIVFILTTGCSTIKQNVDARKNLVNCKYEFEKLEPVDVTLNGLSVENVNFDVYLKIINTTKSDAALDRVEGDVLLDALKMTDIDHKKFLRIRASETVVDKISIGVALNNAIKSLGKKPETITVSAKVYVSLLIGDSTIETPIAITVTKTFPIPYDKINEMVEQKKNQGINTIKAKEESIINNSEESVMKKVKKFGR